MALTNGRPRVSWTRLGPMMSRSIGLLASVLLCGCTATVDPSHDGPPPGRGAANAGGSASTWTPGGPQPSVVVPTPRLARLSRLQWENSVRAVTRSSAGGLLQTGRFMDVSDRNYKTNRMLNTLINAAGVRKDDSSLVDDFGDPSLTKDVVDEVMG